MIVRVNAKGVRRHVLAQRFASRLDAIYFDIVQPATVEEDNHTYEERLVLVERAGQERVVCAQALTRLSSKL